MVAVAALFLSSCGGGGGYSSSAATAPSPTTNTSANVVTITILRQNGIQSFSPNPATAGGQIVVFRNADSVVHRVRLNDGTIDTGDLPPGATSRQLQMPASGTHYHCSLHTDMVGAINATGGEPPPACEGPYCGGGY